VIPSHPDDPDAVVVLVRAASVPQAAVDDGHSPVMAVGEG